jgi:hypothetical protein
MPKVSLINALCAVETAAIRTRLPAPAASADSTIENSKGIYNTRPTYRVRRQCEVAELPCRATDTSNL